MITHGSYLWPRGAKHAAARNGHVRILELIRASHPVWNNYGICQAAAMGGQLGVLQWARDKGCPWGGRTCSEAAKIGQFEALKWARYNGCPWDEHTCSHAAAEGRLDMLQ